MGARGLREGLGAAAARASSATVPTTSRWPGCGPSSRCAAQLKGEEAKRGAARLPAAQLRAAVRAPCGTDRGARRARADRPPRRPGGAIGDGGFLVTAGAPAPSGAGTTRATSIAAGEPERYDAVIADRAQRHLRRSCSTTTSRRRSATDYLGRLRRDRVLRGAVPGARARPPVPRPTTGPTWPTTSCRFIGLIEHTNLSRPSATTAATSSTWPTTCRAATSCWARRRRAAGRATSRGCARSTRPSTRSGSRSAGCTRAGRRSRRAPSATASGCPPLRHRRAGALLANTTQIYPEDRGHQLRRALGRGGRGGLAREQRLSRDGVVAAVAPRVAAQQPPARQHDAAQYAVPARPPGPRRPSRSAGTCSGAAAPGR